MSKLYESPELELRRMLSFETISTSADEMPGVDNELDTDQKWPDF